MFWVSPEHHRAAFSDVAPFLTICVFSLIRACLRRPDLFSGT